MMVRALGCVESCQKIAMTVLRSISTAVGLLRQPKCRKRIFTELRAEQILLMIK
jgi:hypothetical protein